jgi:hypothetical protein
MSSDFRRDTGLTLRPSGQRGTVAFLPFAPLDLCRAKIPITGVATRQMQPLSCPTRATLIFENLSDAAESSISRLTPNRDAILETSCGAADDRRDGSGLAP